MDQQLKFFSMPDGDVGVRITLAPGQGKIVFRENGLYFYGQTCAAIGPLEDRHVVQLLDLGARPVTRAFWQGLRRIFS